MKILIAAALLAVTAQQAFAGEPVVLGGSVIMCRQAIYAELIQGRMDAKDMNGALSVAREGGCLPVMAGTEIIVTDTSLPKVYGIEVAMLDTRLSGYISRPKSN